MKSLVVRILAVAVVVGIFSGNTLLAQTTGNQTFTVQVPVSLSITAPTNAVSIQHDETNNLQSFPAQSWTVKGNAVAGVNVTFAAAQPFTNVTDTSVKRNAQLGLAVGSSQGPAAWTVDVASDATDYATNKNTAQVHCSSNGAGRASLNLTVKFVTEEYGLFPAGDYVTTVTGTIAAK
ncbi:MAG: hypothetical protein U0892_11175 [Pirellulales bacterium]